MPISSAQRLAAVRSASPVIPVALGVLAPSLLAACCLSGLDTCAPFAPAGTLRL